MGQAGKILLRCLAGGAAIQGAAGVFVLQPVKGTLASFALAEKGSPQPQPVKRRQSRKKRPPLPRIPARSLRKQLINPAITRAIRAHPTSRAHPISPHPRAPRAALPPTRARAEAAAASPAAPTAGAAVREAAATVLPAPTPKSDLPKSLKTFGEFPHSACALILRTHPKSTLSPPWRLGRALRERCFSCRACRREKRFE